VEQTVEVPEPLIDARIEAEVVGDVLRVEPRPEGGFVVEIAYSAALACGQLPQLVNLVYGNVSLMRSVRLVDLALPGDLLSCFRGPNFGVAGLRALTGVADRPLLCTALKPRGTPVARLAEIAGAFARAGGDLVKDDHNLVDADLDAMVARVARCQDAVSDANAATGGRCVYAANLVVPNDRLADALDLVWERGVRGILVPPLIAGLDAVRALAARREVVVFAHPSFSGGLLQDRAHGIDPGVLMGTLYRLAGVDVSVFVNSGGRFDFTPEECGTIARRLRDGLVGLAPAWPAPAGGMHYDRIGEMVRRFGRDTVLLIGGALLGHGTSIADGTRAYLDRVRAASDARDLALSVN
jgi:ribulose-bisphosphate carboxylase large chain